jgi:hypothetical protein
MLYAVADYSRHICSNLLRRWISPNGLVVFAMASQSERPDSVFHVLRRLNPEYYFPTYEDFHQMLSEPETGFNLDYEFEVCYRQDLTNADEGVAGTWGKVTRKVLSVDDVRKAVLEVWPNGTTEHRYQKFGFYSLKTVGLK